MWGFQHKKNAAARLSDPRAGSSSNSDAAARAEGAKRSEGAAAKAESTAARIRGEGAQREDEIDAGRAELLARAKIARIRREFSEIKRTQFGNGGSGAHMQAAAEMRKKYPELEKNKMHIGSIPGLRVGDTFDTRGEMSVIGLHYSLLKGITTIKHQGVNVATSVVCNFGGNYPNMYNQKEGVLIYCGEGGVPGRQSYLAAKSEASTRAEWFKDQKLTSNNEALSTSEVMDIPVRVCKGTQSGEVGSMRYTYEGVFKVESHELELSPLGNKIYKFHMRRVEPAQRT